jgi:hypothetical protein
MKILSFGSCRILCLFDKKFNKNNLDIESIHYLNYGGYGGKNIISMTHDAYQVKMILDIIINKKFIYKNNKYYNTYKNSLLILKDTNSLQNNYLTHVYNYNINDGILNIYNELSNINHIVIEICTLKSIFENNIPLFIENKEFEKINKISEDQFNLSIIDLIEYILKYKSTMKIVFVSHIISYKGNKVPDRIHILNMLKKIIEKYKNNCYLLCPNDYIDEYEDLEDNTHYKFDKYYKMLDAIYNLIKII